MITPNEQFWKIFKETPGALSCSEALAIIQLAALSPMGTYLELGTHKGKSALSAMASIPFGEFILLEPAFAELGLDFIESIHHLRRATNIMVKPLTYYSTEYLASHQHERYGYVFVDSGSHGDGLPMQEAKLLEDTMMQGGIIAWHDYKNQFVEVEQAYNYLLSTGKYEEVSISWQEIFDYVKEHDLESNNNSWHLYPELPHPPNFVGALRKK